MIGQIRLPTDSISRLHREPVPQLMESGSGDVNSPETRKNLKLRTNNSTFRFIQSREVGAKTLPEQKLRGGFDVTP
jgi:hypothetical protein